MSEFRDAELSRQIFSERKESIIALLDKVTDFYSQEEDESKKNAFETLKADLLNGEFSIVVVGEFSAGKSTLLNALMHKRILPSFTNETTATINFLRHIDRASDGEAGVVYYKDGKTEKLSDASLDVINQYVSTKGRDVVNTIEHLDLYLDSGFLKDGVTLVDSPGLNGVADGHREITEQQILKSHASIFLFNSDHPGSKTDFEFLRDLQRKVKTIIFVLNKIDSIKEEEGETVESVIDMLKQNYKKQFPEEAVVPEIWPVSAYQSLCARTEKGKEDLEVRSRLKGFENRLLTFLTCGEKAHQQLMAPIDRVITIVKETKDILQENINMLSGKEDTKELEDQIYKIQESIAALSNQMGESKKKVKGEVSIALKEVMEDLGARIAKLREQKLNEIDRFDDLEELLWYLERFENAFIQRVYSLAIEGEENLRDRIKTIAQLQYMDAAEMIEEKIQTENTGVKFEIANHLDVGDGFYEVGLKGMDEKIEARARKMEKLEEEAAKAQEDWYKARSLAKEKQKLEIEIQNLRESRDTIRFQQIPPVEYRQIIKDETVERGFIPKIFSWFLGSGEKKVQRVKTIEDREEHDRIKALQEKELEKNDAVLEEKKAAFKTLASGMDSSVMELRHMQLEAAKEKARQELEKQQKEYTEKIQEKYRKQIAKCKRDMGDFCDNITEDLIRQSRRNIKKSEGKYVSAILDVVEANLREQMEEKKKRIQALQEQMKSSEAEKEQRIQCMEEKISQLNSILEMGVNLQVELENEEIDRIEQTNI